MFVIVIIIISVHQITGDSRCSLLSGGDCDEKNNDFTIILPLLAYYSIIHSAASGKGGDSLSAESESEVQSTNSKFFEIIIVSFESF